MNETIGNSTCERADDLVSFLYGETNERETREFEIHLERCGVCRSELASFGQVRESISMWKEEALSTLAPPRVDVFVREKSALAAIRQFFDLSPLWLKGAVGFAVVALCVMAVLVLVPIGKKPESITTSSLDGRYSEEDLKQAVAGALKRQAETLAAASEQKRAPSEPSRNVNVPKKRVGKPSNPSTQWARKPKPLSRSEREQLATDLRLMTTKDNDGLNLLSDRINQEF
jgi:anti-sigma factor RsiW